MLEELNIKGFKCFDSIDISLSSMNIFSGTNSSGKSSAIQAFLLLCNNAVKNSSSPLNGMWLRLGSFDECRNHRTNSRVFQIGTKSNNESFTAEFSSIDDEKNDVAVSFIDESKKIRNLLSFENHHVYYLPANRIGRPEDSYPKNYDRINFLGNKSEYVIDYLYKNRKEEVTPSLVFDNASITLEYQVNFWLGNLFGINTVKDLGLSNSLSLELCKPVRPYHMGSGVSFAIGVLVSCLSAKPDDIIFIENPEIHLHPKAQSCLTEFLCFVANAGIQIVLETHSDHIFNGVRKSIVKKAMSHNDVAVHFFQLDESGLSKNIVISVNEHGHIVTPQKGLFDQFDDDLDEILEL